MTRRRVACLTSGAAWRAWCAAVAGIAAAGPTRAAAQQMTVSVTAVGARVEHRVNAGRGVEQTSGTMFGAAAIVRSGSGLFEGELRALGGQLTADSASADDRDTGELGLRGSVLPMPWLAFQLDAGARTFATAIARQRWTSVGAGVEARLDMADGSVRGIVRATLLPIVSVSGLPRPNLGVAAAAGLEMRSGILTGGLLYSVERYDFPVGTQAKRIEELSALTARFGISFRKP